MPIIAPDEVARKATNIYPKFLKQWILGEDVAEFFITSPSPDCYARQIPVAVDTKFVERNAGTLRDWLDELLPDSAVDINEEKFERRFGLRDGEPHRGVRLLDRALTAEIPLPFGEASLPLRSIAVLPVERATVFIVENNLNLVTLPAFPRGIGIQGAGDAANRLECVKWLANNRVYYWGDIDVEGPPFSRGCGTCSRPSKAS